MAEDLAGRAELIASNDQLEQEIAERKQQLSESVRASLVMTEEMERTQEAVEVAHRKISYLGQFDPVTGLANQSLFQERLQQRLIAAMLEQQKAAVIVLEIERFDAVVQAFGRKGGDELLEGVAERMVRAGAGEAIRFALVGLARFAIVVADVGNPEQIGRYLEQKLALTFRPPFAVQGSEMRLSVKIGIALFPADGADAETLFRNAESALKRSKRTGEKYLFFAQEMTERVAERLSLESRLRDAVDNEDFVLYYQPKFTLATKKVVGAEALIRWNSQGHGLVAPNVFIPILEETGLINDVGRWVLRTALADYARWRAAGLPAVRIAVNVSPTELKSQGFVAQIEALLKDDASLAEGLELEITESVIMDDVERNIAVLQAIRDLGVTIAIDDFGTGYSSLSYLAKLPVDTLKIDRSFISGMTTTPGGQSLIAAIITLAHSLSLRVVAEGVETGEQSRLLQMLECDEVQGYLFGRPEPGGEFRPKYLTRMPPARHPSATSSV
jgi:diguanylate cyclase (GGDEF)-like protein